MIVWVDADACPAQRTMENAMGSLSQAQRGVLIVALGLLACTGGATQPLPNPVCPTCETRAASENADVGERAAGEPAGSSARTCDGEVVPLTPAAEQVFDLVRLRAFLEGPNTVHGRFVDGENRAVPAEQSATEIELRFELGEFSYYAGTVPDGVDYCGQVRASAHVQVRVGDGLLLFEADGILWKTHDRASALFQAHPPTDLATATGSYEPALDTSKDHTGEIHTTIYVFPGQLRGDITPIAFYFNNEAQRQRRVAGDPWAYADRQALFHLSFPEDECEHDELPFAHDEVIELLHGQSADALRARVASLIPETTVIDAVWSDNSETRVTIALGDPVLGTVCVGSSRLVGRWPPPSYDLALRMPLAGRLRSTDRRIDLPISRLVVGVDNDNAIPHATLGLRVPTADLSDAQRQALAADADLLSGRVTYDFDPKPTRIDGMLDLHKQKSPQSYTPTGCVAFPPGGKSDTACRYPRRVQ
jgi:hypothetical protein